NQTQRNRSRPPPYDRYFAAPLALACHDAFAALYATRTDTQRHRVHRGGPTPPTHRSRTPTSRRLNVVGRNRIASAEDRGTSTPLRGADLQMTTKTTLDVGVICRSKDAILKTLGDEEARLCRIVAAVPRERWRNPMVAEFKVELLAMAVSAFVSEDQL